MGLDEEKIRRMGIKVPNIFEFGPREKRMLFLLIDQMKECRTCYGREGTALGGFVPPFIGNKFQDSGIMLLGEAPGKEEVDSGFPFTGKAGKKLWECFENYSLYPENFMIWNSINCRPVKPSGGNGKPDVFTTANCFEHFRRAVKIVNPRLIVALGQYAIDFLPCRTFGGVKRMCGRIDELSEEPFETLKVKVLYGIHPASTIYDSSNMDYLKIVAKRIVEFQREGI